MATIVKWAAPTKEPYLAMIDPRSGPDDVGAVWLAKQVDARRFDSPRAALRYMRRRTCARGMWDRSMFTLVRLLPRVSP